ncbi:uncharacterized protein K460DRAFT_49388 [Cucurbitaria berberidis CBS 394.84]|uniref:SH3 domain-containing protein n=1 Tax=Cucurbitaria berberidis CBS 394.84 TaxID=1168544 RepID=A0A9P4GJT0_9PLEO|nr:uncharacterized protein K460DRAFT_49388 [Cucurbitaria berberidis CBS 394.84]KAF1846870.1 hypothetical protein K460DRAFT_49388 [Cucurbitaria berberidis CBS 394.84]
MTRPEIIRADTHDLQNKSSPTAQDHSLQPERPAPLGIGPAAPHQQAAIRNVEEERSTEEARLQNAWSDAGTALREDPGSDDDRTVVNHANGHKGTQQDEQAIKLNGGVSGDGDGDDADLQDADEDDESEDDMMDKISSSPSIDDEDIDFEFVYALHTFVATVEGQANATKGDTMVLLDDSNSYWWLVRVVKDSSIGYLPAEHIETPTERLARLNKHRNIDLSATMLGDTAEKSKNPLKKAMRRRNAKTVQFAPPTYVEASDYDYSSDEGDDELFGGPEPAQVQQQQQQDQQQQSAEAETEQEEGLKVQPLKVNGAKKDANGQPETDARSSSEDPTKRDEDPQRGSEDMSDQPLDPKISRNGTLRNTDSFFKDENTETRKISLTPNLLRDDSSTSTTGSRERGPSLESLEKNGFADKVKDKKDKKEKKPGMLSGLFKRKDKKARLDSIDSDIEKPEEVDRSSPQSKPSEESTERPSAEQTVATAAPQRQPSKGKLQKAQRTRDDSPQKTKGILKTDSPTETMMQPETTPDAPSTKPAVQETASTMRLVAPEQEGEGTQSVEERTVAPVNRSASTSRNPFKSKPQQNGEAKLEKVKQAKQRVQLDDFDTDSDESNDPFADPDAQTRSAQPEPSQNTGRLSESPVHVSAADAQPSSKSMAQEREKEPDPRQPPGLTTDNSSQETSSPISTPTPDDSPMKTIPENRTVSTLRSGKTPSPTNLAPNSNPIPAPSRPAPVPGKEHEPSPPISSDSTMLPAWSDASLRAYLDDGSDIRDTLLLVNDTTGVVPVGRDHPLMRNLFVEETKAVQGLSGQLDRLLNGLMEKRMKRAGSASSKMSTASGKSANASLHSSGR